MFIACVDVLTGFPEAIEAIFPQPTVQLCIVHLVRNSLSYVSYKDQGVSAWDASHVDTPWKAVAIVIETVKRQGGSLQAADHIDFSATVSF